MSREITVASILPGAWLRIVLDGPQSFAGLTLGNGQLALVCFDPDTVMVPRPMTEITATIRIGSAAFEIEAQEVARLQAWLAEVRA